MVTLFFAFSLVGIISFVQSNPVQNEIEGAVPDYYEDQYYNLAKFKLADNGNPDEDYEEDYDKHTYFGIGDYQGLKVLAMMIAWDEETFAGKHVALFNDIDCGGATISIGCDDDSGADLCFFGTTFNGNNHTISNFKLNASYAYETISDGVDAVAFGFFNYIVSGTTVTNLRLYNYSIEITDSKLEEGDLAYSDGVAVGGIVGFLAG